MNYIYYLIFILIYLIYGIILYNTINLFLINKKHIIYKIVSYIVFLGIGTVQTNISDISSVLIPFLSYIVIVIICFKSTLIKKISVVIILYPIIASIDFIGNSIADHLIKDLFQLISLSLLFFIIKNKLTECFYYLNSKTLYITDCISLAPFITVMIIPTITTYNELSQVLIIVSCCLITNTGILLLISYLVTYTKNELDQKYSILKSQYYITLDEKQTTVQKLHHDLNNHLQLINNYLTNKQYNLAIDYCNNICSVSKKNTVKIFCRNTLVNAVINNKYNIIAENNIDCELHISIDEIVKLNDIDLCSLFSNSIDNAIEANMKLKDYKERHISLKTRVAKGYFSYLITNTFNGSIIELDDTIKTNKTDKIHHGFGLLAIKDIVNKYNGTIEIKHNGNIFSLFIIIKL